MKILAVSMLMLVCPASLGIAAEVTASLDRESVQAGEGAALTLTVTGGRAEKLEIPTVENFIFQSRGQGQNVQITNGRTTMSFTYSYAVGSNTPGDYQIPAFEVTVDGKKYSTQPLQLKVLAAGAAAEQEPEAETDEKRLGFLTVELADPRRKHAYVGEIAPVIIRAWFPEGSQVQLRGRIQPEGKGFTLHNVSEYQEGWEIKDGKRYTVVTWFGGISATKAGKLPASLSVDMTFPLIRKDITLKSDDQEIEVRALPAEGRPGGFTGAVGDFKFDSAEFPNSWKTGEPRQITAQISGSGNFALMKAPELTPADAWKIYPGKDGFRAGDQASFSGSKAFQFSAVPKKGGEQDAALEFSYFDPAAGAYKTITWPVSKIQVSGNDMVEDKPAAAPEVKEPEKKSAGMIGPHEKMSPRGLLMPLVSRQAFIEMLATSGVLCALGAILGWFRIRREDPRRRAREAMEKAIREAVEAAGAAKDVPGFFAAARLAIQQRLGALWNQPAQAITTAEINARIPRDSPVARFFEEADRHEYSRQGTGEIQPQWRSLLAEALTSLTPSTR